MTGPPTFSASCSDSLRAAQAAAAGQDGDLRAGVDDAGGLPATGRPPGRTGCRPSRLAVVGDVVAGTLGRRRRQFLDVFGDADVGDAAAREGGADGLIDDVGEVGRPHHALAVDGHVHEQLDEVHVLLVVRVDQVGEGVPRDRQHRLAVALRVVEAVEQVNSAGPEVARQTPSSPVYLA